MQNLFIIKRITEDTSISNEAFAVWCALRNIMVKDKYAYFVSFNMIADSLFNHVPTRHESEIVKKGYKELVEKEFIKILDSYSQSEFKVDLSALYYKKKEDEFFSDLTEEEMHQIMNFDAGQTSRCGVLRYFTCMIGTFNRSNDFPKEYRGKIGGMSLEGMNQRAGNAKGTAVKYNELLEKHELLFVIRHKDFYSGRDSNGQGRIREIPNTYSRWADQELAKEFASTTHGYKYNELQKDKKSAEGNRRRGLTQKYNHFVAGKTYSIDEVKEIYEHIHEQNIRLKRLAENSDEEEKAYILSGCRSEECFAPYLDEDGNFVMDGVILNTPQHETMDEILDSMFEEEMEELPEPIVKTVWIKNPEPKIVNDVPATVKIDRFLDGILGRNPKISDEELKERLLFEYPMLSEDEISKSIRSARFIANL